jgi:hypothetical protein
MWVEHMLCVVRVMKAVQASRASCHCLIQVPIKLLGRPWPSDGSLIWVGLVTCRP